VICELKDVWDLGATLIRLDLGFNALRRLPDEIAALTSLEQLWLNDNPLLVSLSAELGRCKRLQVPVCVKSGTRTHPLFFFLFVH
jgi:hypothetical protein